MYKVLHVKQREKYIFKQRDELVSVFLMVVFIVQPECILYTFCETTVTTYIVTRQKVSQLLPISRRNCTCDIIVSIYDVLS